VRSQYRKPSRTSHRQRPQFSNLDDIIDLLESLPNPRVGTNNYTEKDRAQDFLAVFTNDSNSVQGRRVLSQLSTILNPASNVANADKAGTLAFNEGKRAAWQEVLRCFAVRAAPVIQKRKDDG
jgi:hypothetical protein